MSPSIELSIIIVNWNSSNFLEKCLASIEVNARQVQYEVIVVDNASFDGSKEVVEHFQYVTFIQLQLNCGFAKANNIAFAQSRGQYILFLNPDTEIVGNAIPQMLAVLKSKAGGIVGAKLLNTDLSVQSTCVRQFPSILNQVFDSSWLQNKFPRCWLWKIGPLFEHGPTSVAIEALCGACMLLDRQTFQEVGKFSEEYFMYSEDVDLCYKAHQKDRTIYLVPQALVVHHGGASSASAQSGHFSDILMRESRFMFLTKSRGKSYAHLYRATTACVASLRILLLTIVYVCSPSKRQYVRLAIAKWFKCFRWAVSLERWAGALQSSKPNTSGNLEMNRNRITQRRDISNKPLNEYASR
jgi:GT2 family glycosyltransferase